ncbi:ABC transporter ATP-binding protein [Candidatus Saccharibacteria bacterium]|nr:ABC transporter ATP-binding protein [Candidatus Saccharibacteria bacterium]
MNDDIAVSVKHISKDFRLPHEKVSSVKGMFVSAFRRKRTVEVQHALKDISFDIKKGEFFGIVGRNGSGKSTLLKIITGIYQPTKGTISLAGKLVPFIELGVGFNPELSGRENVYLNGALLGFSDAEIDAMYDDIVAFAELEKFMDQKLKNYSSGMQVRLAFSVATRAKSDILLIDEVLAVGDADFQRKCFNYFKELKKSRTTVIFVTHDMEAVREYCDRAILIEKSTIIKQGKASDVAKSYSRLFMRKQGPQSNDNLDMRWGSGEVKLTSISVKQDTELKITMKLHRYSVPEGGVVAGFRVRSASGGYVMGTNSKLERRALKFNNRGECTVTFVTHSILADGTFLIDSAIHGEDGVSTYDWFDEAARLTVQKDRKMPYLIDPGFSVTID